MISSPSTQPHLPPADTHQASQVLVGTRSKQVARHRKRMRSIWHTKQCHVISACPYPCPYSQYYYCYWYFSSHCCLYPPPGTPSPLRPPPAWGPRVLDGGKSSSRRARQLSTAASRLNRVSCSQGPQRGGEVRVHECHNWACVVTVWNVHSDMSILDATWVISS